MKHKLIKLIFKSTYFKNKPPVLIDIGVSEEMNAKLEQITPYSICLAFHADGHNFKLTKENYSTFKKLIKISSCWCELTYLKEILSCFSVRQLLIVIVFEFLEMQNCYVLEICEKGHHQNQSTSLKK